MIRPLLAMLLCSLLLALLTIPGATATLATVPLGFVMVAAGMAGAPALLARLLL